VSLIESPYKRMPSIKITCHPWCSNKNLTEGKKHICYSKLFVPLLQFVIYVAAYNVLFIQNTNICCLKKKLNVTGGACYRHIIGFYYKFLAFMALCQKGLLSLD
jgi:hypothetical protein